MFARLRCRASTLENVSELAPESTGGGALDAAAEGVNPRCFISGPFSELEEGGVHDGCR